MTKQQTKPPRPQTVAAAEAVLRDLETKRDKCVAFGRELAEARRAHAYQAHAVHDPDDTGGMRKHHPSDPRSDGKRWRERYVTDLWQPRPLHSAQAFTPHDCYQAACRFYIAVFSVLTNTGQRRPEA
jgi:hypothetical protein